MIRQEIMMPTTTKCCARCESDKFIREFNKDKSKKDGLSVYCKTCSREKDRARYDADPEKRRDNTRNWRKNNREKHRKYCREYEKINAEDCYKRLKKRLQGNVHLRIKYNLRHRLSIVKNRLNIKGGPKTMDMLGCSLQEFRDHLESQFTEGMSWENHGKYVRGGPMTWHIDHIRPCASFDLTDPEQQKACFHWSNMQPLWAVDNLAKGDNPNWSENESSK